MDLAPSPAKSDLDEAVAAFVQHRPRLLGIAYRILASAAEAEDVVQEVWLRRQKTDRSVVINPAAFLSSTATRLAINVAQSARVRRETYIEPWLPEPVDTSGDPELGAQRAEAAGTGPAAGAAEARPHRTRRLRTARALDYGYPEIARTLHLSLVNVRKIVSRARRRLADEQRESVDTAGHRRLLQAFVSAARTGDVASLETVLTPDAVSLSDGNGARGCARLPGLGRTRVAQLSVHRQFWRVAGRPALVAANGRTGAVIHREGGPPAFVTVAASKEGIHTVLCGCSARARSRRSSLHAHVGKGPGGSFHDRSLSGLRIIQTYATR